ncbi:MAG: peptidoglycan DD-metalloendopeptidase family protein [Erysipelotrichaceae bacterium]|nr:peptidoglycan DD-metalloendopeptidase family protein [Erysipelotrichaceae bacterium]MDD3923794.1 peptidoglycan DD-metalloendopeptidase family protein [Erysipelotrichaceae bacterium]MDD4642416.1 peptidoglycan DD-metalloendopeptidase family protein [Erysipelotrichaceae bacterium]
MKKILSYIICIAIIFSSSYLIVFAVDFAGNESYYDSLCSVSLTDPETIELCKQYQLYLNQIANDRLDELEDIEDMLDNLKDNIAENVKKVHEYQDQIAEIEEEIASLNRAIAASEESIKALEKQILKREARINEIDEAIQDRMLSMQSFIRVNNYIEFLIGSTSFLDLIRRIEALADIEASDHHLMDELNTEIEGLEVNRAELARQIETLNANKANVEANKKYIEGLMAFIEEALVEYYRQEADLEAQANQIAQDYSASVDKLKDISEALGNILPSPGWTKPVSGGRVTASTWYYPASFGGGVHLGVDIAQSIGTTVKAVANGVVLYRANACSTYGYLGNTCGYPGSTGGGNQIYLLVSVGSKTYAIKYLHLEKDSPIATGTIVSAGDEIGRLGTSGNSSGPHVHIEIFYLGEKSISHYADNWNGDMSFGAGWGSAALSKTCENTGDVAPCRLPPKTILGY